MILIGIFLFLRKRKCCGFSETRSKWFGQLFDRIFCWIFLVHIFFFCSSNTSFAFLQSQWFSNFIDSVFFLLFYLQRICVRHRYKNFVPNNRSHQIELITSVSTLFHIETLHLLPIFFFFFDLLWDNKFYLFAAPLNGIRYMLCKYIA